MTIADGTVDEGVAVDVAVAALAQLASNERLQKLSRTLFGQAHRLAVMTAIARSDGDVNPGDLAEQLGFRAQSSIQGPMRDLVEAGLISELPEVPGMRRKYYRREESKVWAWIEEVAAQFEQERSSHRS